jgi:hypothetical protein
MKYEPHPACKAWPEMPQDELQALAEDIRTNGLREPITLTPDNLLLDGRSREAACEMIGIEALTIIYEGDPFAFSLSKNKFRKHLSKAELAMATARLHNLQHGSNRFQRRGKVEASGGGLYSREELAAQSGVHPTQIERARYILKNGQPSVIAMVDQGQVSLAAASKALINSTADEQNKWTPKDVKQRSGQYDMSHRTRSPTASKPPKPPKVNFMNREILRLDKNRDIGTARTPNQPINLFPAHIEALHKDQITVGVAATQVHAFAGRLECEPDGFIAALERLLAYQAITGKNNGEETDFARLARKDIALLDQRIDRLIDWLVAIRGAITPYRTLKAG